MKKLFSFVCIAVLVLNMMGCSSKSEQTVGTEPDAEVTNTTVTAGPVTEAPVQAEPEPVAVMNPVISEEDNLLSNGTFSVSTELAPWNTYFMDGAADFSIQDEALLIKATNVGSVMHGIQIYQDGFVLREGVKYAITFDAKASVNRQIEVRAQKNGGDYHAYGGEIFDITTEMKSYRYDFTMEEAGDPSPRFAINMGKFKEPLAAHDIVLDNIALFITDESGAVVVNLPKAKEQFIQVSQAGYLTEAEKIAIFHGEKLDTKFNVINRADGSIVYTGELTHPCVNSPSRELTACADFSSVKTPGTYYIQSELQGESYDFVIGDDIYDNCYQDIVRMLYLQRCGCEVEDAVFGHPSCHTGLATIYGTDKKIDVSGGWHDAGDFGRYVVSGAKTLEDLFLSFENTKAAQSDSLGIKESGNQIPDVLDEARYELDWMFKMQNKEGGVYHKVTCASFPGDVMPQDETSDLIVCPVSYSATADFAAVMARASQIYAAYDKEYSARLLDAAKKAYIALATMAPTGFTNPEGISTGAYDDTKLTDELAWASAELYSATKEQQYKDALSSVFDSSMTLDLGWQEVSGYAAYAYLSCPAARVSSDQLIKKLNDAFIAKASAFVEDSNNDGYFTSLGMEYVWGSNMTVANHGMFLMLANQLQPSKDYVKTACEHLYYCLGMNPMGICYVTGYGIVTPISTHHRPSTALGSTMPGMLVGGPNKNLEDPVAQGKLRNVAPAKCYVDNQGSYSTNEITIYWNSPLIYLMSEFK